MPSPATIGLAANTYLGFNVGPCPLLPIIKFCVGVGRAQRNWIPGLSSPQVCGLHQEWMGQRKHMGTPQFSLSRECWEGMDVLQSLSYVGAVAQAGSWDKTCGSGGSRSVCMMRLTSQTKASHILPSPSHFIAWALQADGFQSVFS